MKWIQRTEYVSWSQTPTERYHSTMCFHRHVFSIPKFDSRLPRDGARSFVTSVPDVTTLHTAISDFQDVENKVSSRKWFPKVSKSCNFGYRSLMHYFTNFQMCQRNTIRNQIFQMYLSSARASFILPEADDRSRDTVAISLCMACQ